MGLIIRLAIYALAVWVAVWVVGGLEFDGDWFALAGIAVILAIVNAVVRPVLRLLSLPLIILTLGLFLLLVNAISLALVIWLSGQFDLGLASSGFGATFLGAIVISIVTWAGEAMTDRD